MVTKLKPCVPNPSHPLSTRMSDVPITRHTTSFSSPEYLFPNPSSNISDVADLAECPESDVIGRILTQFQSHSQYRGKLFINSLRHNISFKSEVLKLSPYEIDAIVQKFSFQNSENAIGLFFFLQNDLGIKHSRSSLFVVAHLLAEKKRLSGLRCHLLRVVQDEDNVHRVIVFVEKML